MKRFISLSAFSCALIAGSAIAASDVAPAARPVPSAARDVEELLGKLQREERSARERFDELGKIADTAGMRALARGRAFTRLARAGLLPIGGGFRAFIDHATRIERLRQGLARDVAEQQHAIAERAELARKLEDLRARLGPLQVEQQAMARAEVALLSADDRERAFQRAFQSSSDPHTAVYGALGPSDPLDDSAGFAAKRGRLPFPLAGRAEIRRARRSGSEGPGLEMRAPLGTPVRAVHAGRVAFADDYADYGKTVIIDHGGRYYTVSANLGTIEVAVGDEVATNARLGTVGDNGQGALVYFEIRAPRGSADPSEWFGI
jgi:murein DD-endopeptidase MepM/ murein hydrolase activator NlpD